jgi:Gram-negative bacterial TonB protein C-terminal/PilZ domain
MPNTQDHFGSFTATRDRRHYSRKTTSSLTYVKLGDSNGGIVLNIGEAGLAMTAADVLVGEYLPCMRFQLPKCARWIETKGQIVWLTASKKGAGIQFVDLAEEDRDQIRQWISPRGSPSEIHDTTKPVGKSGNQIKITPPRTSRTVIPWTERVDEPEETQFGELFPSESGPPARPEVKRPTAVHVQPPIPQTDGPAAVYMRPPITQTNGPAADSLPDIAWPFRSDPVEPVTVQRSKLHLAILGGLLVATSLAMGVVLGHGSFESLLGSIERLMPERSQLAPTVAPSLADSGAGRSNPSSVDAPEQSANISAQSPPTPASPIPSASASGNEGTQVTGTPPDAPRVTKSAENQTEALDQPGEPILVTAPSEGDHPFRLTVPEKAVSASSSLAISSQGSILVPPEPGPASFHQPERLSLGDLTFYVEPQYPQGRDQIETEEIVKLRATVGEDGQITDVKRISGPMHLIPAAISAVREWRYTPTLLDGRPIKTEQDVTIEFRAR